MNESFSNCEINEGLILGKACRMSYMGFSAQNDVRDGKGGEVVMLGKGAW